MKLENLFENIENEVLKGSIDKEIIDVTYDYRQVNNDYLYISIENDDFDGYNYIDEAINNGATAIVVQHDINVSEDITVIKVKDTKKVFSKLVMKFFKFPQNKIKTIAVTGTKGKTTVSLMIKEILEKSGNTCSIISDKYFSDNNSLFLSYNILKQMNDMVDNKIDYVIMEVSNKTLKSEILNNIIFDYGVFINILQEQIELDKYNSIENYIDIKGKLFSQCNHGIFNIDDKHFYDMIQRGDCSINTYGYNEKADLRIVNIKTINNEKQVGIKMDTDGVVKKKFILQDIEKNKSYNALAAILTCNMLGIDSKYMVDALNNFTINKLKIY